jgi:hypothetical protein
VKGEKETFDEWSLFGCVEADGVVGGDEDLDAGAVFEGAELFEGLGLL